MMSLLVVFVFLAAVTSKDHWGYLEALAIKMLKDFLIVWICVAALLTLMVWLWMSFSAQLRLSHLRVVRVHILPQ